MARGGINKVVVQQARQALIARGENPSIDAIRIELGNTGSKTTIHRYLKELNGQQPVAAEGGIALSDVLSRMVGQLATQLQDEADLRIEQAESTFTAQREQLEAQLAITQQALAAAHQQHQIDVAALAAESEKLLSTQSTLQAEQLRSASLNQSLGELQVRLADKDEQVKSLEDKHRHARDALEHYRTASREQREQEQRRHEAQLQQLQVEVRQLQQGLIVKQDELTRLHRDNERLLGEHRQAASACRAQDELLEQRDAQIQGLRTILAQAQGASEEMRRQLDVQAKSLEERRDLCAQQARQLLLLEEQLATRDAALKECQLQLSAAVGTP
ncbi:DNA-binding protein [Pseudomonas sp. Leaf58]|uniref:DNA-binding protein n=1 Tax=Pseudomonas TaxID=286 RepID=UPI0006FFA051|nr:DNA-binding protein [Pseudomonas sp. Leaf58]AYG45062.1 DNA-binding protein [Pseudomonas sp. Leaf58]KQN59395.1 cointegrate resolution protein T [Pseudomonas sp. Leaf58]